MGPGMGSTHPPCRVNHSAAWTHGYEASAICRYISLEGAGGNMGCSHLATSQLSPPALTRSQPHTLSPNSSSPPTASVSQHPPEQAALTMPGGVSKVTPILLPAHIPLSPTLGGPGTGTKTSEMLSRHKWVPEWGLQSLGARQADPRSGFLLYPQSGHCRLPALSAPAAGLPQHSMCERVWPIAVAQWEHPVGKEPCARPSRGWAPQRLLHGQGSFSVLFLQLLAGHTAETLSFAKLPCVPGPGPQTVRWGPCHCVMSPPVHRAGS